MNLTKNEKKSEKRPRIFNTTVLTIQMDALYDADYNGARYHWQCSFGRIEYDVRYLTDLRFTRGHHVLTDRPM